MWNNLCEQTRLDVSPEEQTKEREDLLGYLRLWDPREGEELFCRMVAHPDEEVRFQVRSLIYGQTCREAPDWDALCDYIVDMWQEVKQVEEKDMNEKFKTLDEAIDWLNKPQNKTKRLKKTI